MNVLFSIELAPALLDLSNRYANKHLMFTPGGGSRFVDRRYVRAKKCRFENDPYSAFCAFHTLTVHLTHSKKPTQCPHISVSHFA